jgi:hypothetical protein
VQAREPDAYLAQRIREVVATEVGQLGLHVETTGDLVILRGRLDSEPLRGEVLRAAASVAEGRRIVDETERPGPEGAQVDAPAERIDP